MSKSGWQWNALFGEDESEFSLGFLHVFRILTDRYTTAAAIEWNGNRECRSHHDVMANCLVTRALKVALKKLVIIVTDAAVLLTSADTLLAGLGDSNSERCCHGIIRSWNVTQSGLNSLGFPWLPYSRAVQHESRNLHSACGHRASTQFLQRLARPSLPVANQLPWPFRLVVMASAEVISA